MDFITSNIGRFETVAEAVSFAKEINPESELYKDLYDIDSNDVWLVVIGICDICQLEQVFFIPSIVFKDGIKGSECSKCGNMSVYPKEGVLEDE